MKYQYSPPRFIKNLFNEFIWDSGTDNILFTFDDGPNPKTTEKILLKLSEKNIKAIFFCVGENLLKYNSLAKEIIDEGHDLGNHTFSHQKITRQRYHDAELSVAQVQQISEERLSYKIKFFRPPHGRFGLNTSKLLKQFGLRNVMWSLLTYDYKNDLNIVKFAIEKYMAKNSIIVLHDNIKSEDIIVDSIDYIYRVAENRKFSIGKPAECLKSYF